MPQASQTEFLRIERQGEMASELCNSVFVDDDRPVMTERVDVEYAFEEGFRYLSAKGVSALYMSFKRVLALQDNECPGLFQCKISNTL